ncbi:MAG: FixH family protein [Bacteroidota bacterium]|nr:FixH family protein [Candidatus Kapabacteria bacterium]MDW8219646.1 FixH family protein [Bacteroidota bacterium]
MNVSLQHSSVAALYERMHPKHSMVRDAAEANRDAIGVNNPVCSLSAQNGKAWMIGVLVVYSSFALITLILVVLSFKQKVDLVSDTYYQQEVAFQERIDAANRAYALAEPVQWRIVERSEGKVLEIIYPQQMRSAQLSGTITLFRHSALGLDAVFPVQPDSTGRQYISLAGFMQGFWTVSLEWTYNKQSYYKAADIML